MKKVLVTGGCGFIGSHLSEFLVKKGYKKFNLHKEESVVSVSKSSKPFKRNFKIKKMGSGKVIKRAVIRINKKYLKDINSYKGLLTITLHEIGNVLGLGDIKPSKRLKSILEDPLPVKFDDNELWDFDKQLIKQVYDDI